MQKDLLDISASQKRLFKKHPEILSLRVDNRKSPVGAIPVDLREPLVKIFLQHATGAVRREGKRWRAFDLISDSEMHLPFPFEIDINHVDTGPKTMPTADSQKFVWGELTWPDAKKRLAGMDVALLPVGAIEQHGPHLPLDTDVFDADYLARRVAEACSEPRPLVLPNDRARPEKNKPAENRPGTG